MNLYIKVSLFLGDIETPLVLPGKYLVCDMCKGFGQVPDPKLLHLSNDDQNMICNTCKGIRVVPVIDFNLCTEQTVRALVDNGYKVLNVSFR